MFIGQSTAKTYVARLYDKLGAGRWQVPRAGILLGGQDPGP